MNKKNNRKGFTIVELVIVIAVIAILATVMVPTFGNVIGKANNAALIQEIKNEHTMYVTKTADQGTYSDTVYIRVDVDGTSKYYLFDKGELQMTNNVPAEKDLPTNKEVVVFCGDCDTAYKTAQAGGATAFSDTHTCPSNP